MIHRDPPEPESSSAQVALLAPGESNAAHWLDLLTGDGYRCSSCGDLDDLHRELERGSDVAIVTEEGLGDARADTLPRMLDRHPGREEATILLLAGGPDGSRLGSWVMDTLADVIVLERPVSDLTLRSAVRSGVEGRRRRLETLDRLREADRRKDEFLGMLAHELRNPLAPLRAGLDLLRLGESDSTTLEMVLGTMDRQIAQLVRMVNDLLEVSRITRGKIVLRKERVELADVVRRAVESCQPLLDRVPHELTLDVPAAAPLDADPVRLTQVVANLLDNAARYTEEGGHITIRARRVGEWIALSVLDDGIGISPQLLPRIFEPFSQEQPSMSGRGGLGLGLTLVRELVRLHGGTVEAKSDGVGCGSEILVRLPAPPTVEPKRPRARESTGQSPAPVSVLVVDDNVDSARTLGALLRRMGHDVHVAHDGVSALEEARQHPPQLVLLDLGMPGLDGYAVARRIRRERVRDVRPRLVALTGYGNDEARRRSREAGFDEHLVKPIDLASLRSLLARPASARTPP
jgi:signal transduction histidine kinase/ActR/RegA family two-component response regulator